MPATARRKSSSSQSSGGKSDSTLIAVLGLAAAGGAYFLLKPKEASAAVPGSSSATPPVTQKPAAATPSTSTASAARPTSELSEELKQQMAEALGRLGVSPATGKLSGTADADAIRYGSQLVGTLDAMGFKEASAALRKYVDEAAKGVQTPVEAKPIAAAAPAALTQEQRDYIARVMILERDPNKIGLLIDWLKKLSPSLERDSLIQMAQALALQLAAAQSTAATMSQIDEVIRSPGIAQVQQAAAQALPSLPAIPITPPPSQKLDGKTDGGNPIQTQQTVVTSPGLPIPGQKPSLPENPAVVPPKPVPQPVPVPATPTELSCAAMIANLKTVQAKYGVSGAKGKEDKNLVKKFQQLSGAAPDGAAGPATLILAAGKGCADLPLVYYWPKTATATTVQQYKDSLERIAQKLLELGRTADAASLRASAAREKGQAGVTGVATTTTAPKPAPAAPKPVAAPAKPVEEVVDPRPTWPIIKQGRKDTAADRAAGTDYATQWQKLLIRGGFLPNVAASADGIFGGGTTAATKALQKAAGMVASAQDGVVGPNTRKSANYMRLW